MSGNVVLRIKLPKKFKTNPFFNYIFTLESVLKSRILGVDSVFQLFAEI